MSRFMGDANDDGYRWIAWAQSSRSSEEQMYTAVMGQPHDSLNFIQAIANHVSSHSDLA